MVIQAIVKDIPPDALKEYGDALLACKRYHLAHDPIMAGSREERELRRLWVVARMKCKKAIKPIG